TVALVVGGEHMAAGSIVPEDDCIAGGILCFAEPPIDICHKGLRIPIGVFDRSRTARMLVSGCGSAALDRTCLLIEVVQEIIRIGHGPNRGAFVRLLVRDHPTQGVVAPLHYCVGAAVDQLGLSEVRAVEHVSSWL